MSPSQAPRKPVVYLIAQPTISRNKKPINLEGLYAFGEVQTLCPQGDSPTFVPDRVLRTMEGRLADFDPEVDFLVWAGGDTLSAVFAGMLLAEMEVWCFTWLRFERDRKPEGGRSEEGKYVPVQVDLTDPIQVQETIGDLQP